MRKKEYLSIKKIQRKRIKIFKKRLNKAKSLRITNGYIRFLPFAINIENQALKDFIKASRDR